MARSTSMSKAASTTEEAVGKPSPKRKSAPKKPAATAPITKASVETAAELPSQPVASAEVSPERRAANRRLREVSAELEAAKSEHESLKSQIAALDAELSDPLTPGAQKRALRTRKDAIRFKPREVAERMKTLRAEKLRLRTELQGGNS